MRGHRITRYLVHMITLYVSLTYRLHITRFNTPHHIDRLVLLAEILNRYTLSADEQKSTCTHGYHKASRYAVHLRYSCY